MLDGALEHRDSLGNGRILKPGQMQLTSAGHGVSHSEFNPLPDRTSHFLQIWILPRQRGLDPGYTEGHPRPEHEAESKVLVILPDGREGSAVIRQDADSYRLRLQPGQTVTHELNAGPGAWLKVAEGELTFNGELLQVGDGACTETAGMLTFTALKPTEALLFDLR